MLRLTLRLTTTSFVAVVQSGLLLAQVGYSTDFEPPEFAGSATGTTATGQGGFVLPPQSVDGSIYTYAGNTLDVLSNGNGDSQFFAGATTTTDVRADHALTLPGDCRAYVQFDVYVDHGSAATPQVGSVAGSFALRRQPENPPRNVRGGLVARWSAQSPASWNADVFVGPTTFSPAPVPDPAFQDLPAGVWHRWAFTIDLSIGEYTDIRITNGLTNRTMVFEPPAGSMPVPLKAQLLQGSLHPIDGFRLHVNEGGNVVAVDNLLITFGATYDVFGNGCAGALGIPTLQPVPGSLPRLGTSFDVEAGNLGSHLAIMVTGFSDTLTEGGIPLPLDLGPFGFPGCELLVSPDSTETVLGANNTATWSLTIPDVPGLLGTEFFNQAVTIDGPGQLAVSNGGAGCIGH